MNFSELKKRKNIYLYAGENFYSKWDEYKTKTQFNWIGIWYHMDTNLKTQNLGFINENNPANLYNIKHDLTKKFTHKLLILNLRSRKNEKFFYN